MVRRVSLCNNANALIERMWLCLGDLFVKLPQPTAGALIRSDLDQLGLEAANIARSIESKRQTLRQLSASPSMR